MDVLMPDMDARACRTLKQNSARGWCDRPRDRATGGPRPRGGIDAGADDFISKPFN